MTPARTTLLASAVAGLSMMAGVSCTQGTTPDCSDGQCGTPAVGSDASAVPDTSAVADTNEETVQVDGGQADGAGDAGTGG
jgi:hypothetical protein